MSAHGVDAYVVGSVDAHSSEYMASSDERRSFLTGFSGSAGTAVVTASKALLWTDSRYFLQAERQLEGTEWILMRQFHPGVPDLKEWVLTHLSGKVVGLDPAFVPAELAIEWKTTWGVSVSIKEIKGGLIDAIWTTRPEDPCNKIDVHPIEFAGETVQRKLKRVRDAVESRGASVFLMSALDQIAWLFNLRGSDIECNPVFFSYAIVTPENACLFVRGLDEGRSGLGEDVQCHLRDASVSAKPYSRFFEDAPKLVSGKKVLIEPSSCSLALLSLVPDAMRVMDVSPVEKFKATKNDKEIEGLRNACRRDSLALCQLLASVQRRVQPAEDATPFNEIDAADLMSRLRREQPLCVGDSFATISSVGANSALPHYKPEPGTCKVLTLDQIYLIDTGGQYKDGTTDVTRTVHMGEPTAEQKRLYTRVLQGHIALASAVFPSGTPGLMLDSYARQPLWQDGLQYGHGTGHGMGAYLNVHEGPAGIGGGTVPGNKIQENDRMKRVYLMPVEAGYFLSDEPGCYKDGDFGIRIEADLVATIADTPYKMGGRSFLKFEYLTLVPMCNALVDLSLITAQEEKWLDDYHGRIWNDLKEDVASEAKDWLWQATRPLRG